MSARARAVAVLGLAAPIAAQATVWTSHGKDDGAGFGTSVASGGDVDQDLVQDVLVGAPRGHPAHPGPGDARLLSGATGLELRSWRGDANGDRFGFAVAILGDVDGDGRPELAVGAPRADVGAADAGIVRVFAGSSGAPLYTLSGGSASALFGWSLAALGDVDGDLRPDLAVGAPQNGVGTGFVRIVSGASGATIRTHSGAGLNDRYGVSVANAGDVDLDGRPDVAIGIERSDVLASDAGSVEVRSGANGALLRALHGTTALDEFGHAVAGVGDVNNDGRPDLLVGAWNDDAGSGFLPGSVSLWSGLDGAQLGRWIGITADDHLGKSVAAVGDVDGDGRPDFAYSGRHDLNDQHPGDYYVRSGATHELLFFVWGDWIEDELGLAMAGIGDRDGDGLGDFVAGAPEAYHNFPREGYVRLYGGCRGRVVPSWEGCPDTPAYTRLFVRGCPGPGVEMELLINRGLPLATAIVRVGAEAGHLELGTGCASGVRPPVLQRFSLQLDGQGEGRAVWRLPQGLASGTALAVEAVFRGFGSPGIGARTNVVRLTTP